MVYISVILTKTYCRSSSNTVAVRERQNAELLKMDDACQLKSCQLLHNCTKKSLFRGLQTMDDLEIHSFNSQHLKQTWGWLC